MKPLAIDLFCGLGGWAEGFLAEGYDVVGFDTERHVYGDQKYPAQLVLQDVLTLDGGQFKDAAVIVASPPCQEYSYMAMPWTKAKAKAAWYREDPTRQLELNCLFNACFAIAHAAGVPLIVENVKGAQPWVERARGHYGSFYLWGDVPGLMPMPRTLKLKGGDRNKNRASGHAWTSSFADTLADGQKVPGFNFRQFEKTGLPGGSFQSAAVEGLKNNGGSWFAIGSPGQTNVGQNPDGRKGFATGLGKGHDWRQNPSARFNSKSDSRKAASAQIAKIPFPLAQHIARCFK